MQPLFITGTDTDVGKTYVGSRLVKTLHEADLAVHPYKPVETGCTQDGNQLVPADGLQYWQACQQRFALQAITPFRYQPAISPALAAIQAGEPLHLEDLVQAAPASDHLIIEGAGGFYSPLVSDGLNADLAHCYQARILLVVRDQVGCINHTLLTLAAIQHYQLTVVAIVLNRLAAQPPEMNNVKELAQLSSVPIISTHESTDWMEQLCHCVL